MYLRTRVVRRQPQQTPRCSTQVKSSDVAPPNRTLNRLMHSAAQAWLPTCTPHVMPADDTIAPQIICSREKVCDPKRLHQPSSANLLKQLQWTMTSPTGGHHLLVSHTASECANEHSPNEFNPEPTCMRPDPLWPQPTSHE